jgi:hypothetical protein
VTVNHHVAGSSPAVGAKMSVGIVKLTIVVTIGITVAVMATVASIPLRIAMIAVKSRKKAK